jgi:4-hydroxyacetophenone monooxygenase
MRGDGAGAQRHPNWYKNARGVVINTSPWRLVDYKWTQAPDLADYDPR